VKSQQRALAVFAIVGAWMFGLQKSWSHFSSLSDVLMNDPVDQNELLQGLHKVHSFGDTLAWWTGSWAAGDGVKFYRPLPSLLWWCELRVFGDKGAQGFMTIHFASHLLVCFLAFGFLRRVIGGRPALLAIGLWASGALSFLTLPTPLAALDYWKDDVDLWMSLAVISSLWALLSFWKTGDRRFWALAVFAQIVGISIKEMSYITPILALTLLWHQRLHPQISLRLKAMSIAPFFLLVALASVFRFWALGGMGFRFGTNGSWMMRFVSYCVGGRPLFLPIADHDFGPLGVALTLFSLGLWFWSHRRPAIVGAVLGLGCIAGSDWLAGEWFNTFFRLISLFPLWAAMFWVDFLLTTAILISWWRWARGRDPNQTWGYLWILGAYAPLLTAPVTEHALYLVSLGWGIWLAVALESLAQEAACWWKARNFLNKNSLPLSKASNPL